MLGPDARAAMLLAARGFSCGGYRRSQIGRTYGATRTLLCRSRMRMREVLESGGGNAMIDHRTARRSAATRVDGIPLEPDDERALTEHLAACLDCRAADEAYRRDALGLEALVPIAAPASLRATVLALPGRRDRRLGISPWLLIAIAALLLTAALGAVAYVGSLFLETDCLVCPTSSGHSAGRRTWSRSRPTRSSSMPADDVSAGPVRTSRSTAILETPTTGRSRSNGSSKASSSASTCTSRRARAAGGIRRDPHIRRCRNRARRRMGCLPARSLRPHAVRFGLDRRPRCRRAGRAVRSACTSSNT